MAVINNLILKEKTGASTWTDRATLSNPTPGTYSAGYAFGSGIHAIKCTAQDNAGNSADSAVRVFESGSLRPGLINGVVDNVDPQQVTLTTDFSHTNDPTPTILAAMNANDLIINGESAVVPVGTVTEFKLWIAWKAYSDTPSKANIDYASDAIGTHATVGGNGQMVMTSSSGITKSGSQIICSLTHGTPLLGNRIYTFGVKWKDANGVWSITDASREFSICVDLVAPAVTITSPVNGYIYNGAIATVTGNVSDTLA